ncbi:aryl-alcohol dehydrogenase [Pterulicium gracile]|uniref:Aryl-alcohol dehydrogenase n=1 Tax=Pterulicium gracile TaxID=1884261 RepID=A0A5C3QTA7_9AGAR|nr:aryl-alcohol dehydrogenase [Pterula gracilis]
MSQSEQQVTMPYVRLGSSGLKVSRLILGMMSYGSSEWQPWVLGEEEGLEHVKLAYDAGINAFDTANMYSNGLSEEILGKAIKKWDLPRDEIVVMTKLYCVVGREPGTPFLGRDQKPDQLRYVNQHGLSRKHIFDSLKHSLRRLQLEYIDLLQCHRFDYETPISETMEALHDVVKSGMVRYIGMSSCHAWQFHVMQNYAIQHNLTPFISMQNFHALVYREEEREMLPTLKHFGVGCIPWSPLGRGVLTRPLDQQQQTKRGETDIAAPRIREPKSNQEIVRRVEEIAKKKGLSMAQVAVAWSLGKDGITAPIVGTTKTSNLKELIDAVHVKLTDEETKYLEEPYKPLAVFGFT